MSETEIPVGRELDKAVALRVLGWTWEPCEMPEDHPLHGEPLWRVKRHDGYSSVVWEPGFSEDLPEFSTDLAAAWQVVEHLEKRGVCWCASQVGAGRCNMTFWLGAVGGGEAATVTEAICRAALRLVEAQEREGGQP